MCTYSKLKKKLCNPPPSPPPPMAPLMSQNCTRLYNVAENISQNVLKVEA